MSAVGLVSEPQTNCRTPYGDVQDIRPMLALYVTTHSGDRNIAVIDSENEADAAVCRRVTPAHNVGG